MKTLSAEEWHTEFMLALMATNASEREVAEAAADVESFCADSGQSPAEAFGDPRAYVAQLGIGRPESWRDRLGYLIHVPSLLGIFVVFDGVHHLVDGDSSSLTVGHLVAAVLLTATTVAFATAFFRGRMVVASVIAGLGLAVSVLGAVTLDRSLLEYPPALGIAAGAALLVATATVGTVQSLRERAEAQAAVAERGIPAGKTENRRGVLAIVVAHWSVVIAAFVFAWAIALIARLAGPTG